MGMIVIVAPQGKEAEDTLDLQRVATLAEFARLGLIGGIDPVGSLLEEFSNQLGGGFENGGAQKFFQVGHDGAAGLGGAKGGNQLLDFFFLGEDVASGVRSFFLTPDLRSWRDVSETSLRCSSTSCLKRS